MTIELHHTYRVIVHLRVWPWRWKLKPQAPPLDGKELVLTAAWKIAAEDREQYEGEIAFLGRDLDPYGIGWIASGDLVVVEEIDPDTLP